MLSVIPNKTWAMLLWAFWPHPSTFFSTQSFKWTDPARAAGVALKPCGCQWCPNPVGTVPPACSHAQRDRSYLGSCCQAQLPGRNLPSGKFLASITTVLLPKLPQHQLLWMKGPCINPMQAGPPILGTTATGLECSSSCNAAAAGGWEGLKRKQTQKKGFFKEMDGLYGKSPYAETI